MKSSPISIAKLIEVAKTLRLELNNPGIYLNIIGIVDLLNASGALDLEIVEEDDRRLDINERAKYIYESNRIIIKESDYLECLKGIGRARFTLAHEFSHYVLLNILELKIYDEDYTKAYENPEWQANTLAAELLCPFDRTLNFSVEDYMKYCGVSEECAIIVYKRRYKK